MKRVQRFHHEITAWRRRRGFPWTNRSTFVLLSCLRVQYQTEQPIGVQVLPTNHGRLHLVELGVNKLEDLVGVTLGPKGRNVVLYGKYGTPKIIKDGVTVDKEVELEDPIENIGVKLVRQAASKTNDLAGDGTTTSDVLA